MVTVFPRINARGVYFKIRDFRGAFIRGGVYFKIRDFRGTFIRGGVYSRGAFISKISKIVETGYGRTKIRKHSCPGSVLFALRHVNKLLPYLQKLAKTKIP